MRKFAGEDTVILQGSYRGTFAVPIDWTDQAVSGIANRENVAPSFLCIPHLVKLADIIEHLRKKGVDT